MSTTIWQTVEMDSISRNFSYDDYVEFHQRTQCKGVVLIKEAYILLKQAFNVQLESDNGCPND